MENPPHELFVGCRTKQEKAARLGRWLVLEELGFFGEETNLGIALEPHPPGTFIGSVRRHVSNMYGGLEGCSKGDVEIAMELLGVMDDIYDFENRKKSGAI